MQKHFSLWILAYVWVCWYKFPSTAKKAVLSPWKQLHEWKQTLGFPFSFHVVTANKTVGIPAVTSKCENSSNSSGYKGLKYCGNSFPISIFITPPPVSSLSFLSGLWWFGLRTERKKFHKISIQTTAQLSDKSRKYVLSMRFLPIIWSSAVTGKLLKTALDTNQLIETCCQTGSKRFTFFRCGRWNSVSHTVFQRSVSHTPKSSIFRWV